MELPRAAATCSRDQSPRYLHSFLQIMDEGGDNIPADVPVPCGNVTYFIRLKSPQGASRKTFTLSVVSYRSSNGLNRSVYVRALPRPLRDSDDPQRFSPKSICKACCTLRHYQPKHF